MKNLREKPSNARIFLFVLDWGIVRMEKCIFCIYDSFNITHFYIVQQLTRHPLYFLTLKRKINLFTKLKNHPRNDHIIIIFSPLQRGTKSKWFIFPHFSIKITCILLRNYTRKQQINKWQYRNIVLNETSTIYEMK